MKRFCVIGDPIEHSKSPQLHNTAFDRLKIDALFEKVQVKPENLAEWFQQKAHLYEGIAVTVPHKETIIPLLSKLSIAAKRIGAVNTIYRDPTNPERFIGTNTDYIGALKALQTAVNPKNKTVLILGAGGAARAVIYGLLLEKARVIIWNRTYSKALSLAQEFSVTAVQELAHISPEQADIIINTTSVGMKEYKSLIPEDFWLPKHIAFDIVYDPLKTKFISDAIAKGAKFITGEKMLIYQAIEQFSIWYGIKTENLEEIFKLNLTL